jgi:hypothetical protein
MKRLFLFAAAAFACVATAYPQTSLDASPAADIYAIGVRQVSIPAPEGFVKLGHRHGRFLSLQNAAEPSENEVFAVHVPKGDLPRFQANFDHAPDIFTKVSVSKIGRDEDVSAVGFEALGTYIERSYARGTKARFEKHNRSS